MSRLPQSSPTTPASQEGSPRDSSAAGGAQQDQPAASGWWPLGFVTAAAAAAAEAVRSTGAGAIGAASESESPDAASPIGEPAGTRAADDSAAGDTHVGEGHVRFHPDAMAGGQGRGRRRAGRGDTVANMGFVELVENLLLTHEAAGRPMSRSSTSVSGFTEISEQDSDVDSIAGRTREQEGDEEETWEWDLEEIGAFAAQIHMKMREQLEQEAAFMEVAMKTGFAIMKGALAIEDDTKMLIREGRLAGLGQTPLDDAGQSPLTRIALSNLMTLTVHNYEQWQRSLCTASPQPALSVRSSNRRSSGRRLLASTGLVSDRLRSPLFKMHRELARLGSTSSDDSDSGSDTDSSGNSRNGDIYPGTSLGPQGIPGAPAAPTADTAATPQDKAPQRKLLDLPGNQGQVKFSPPAGVPLLQLGPSMAPPKPPVLNPQGDPSSDPST